MTSKSKRKQHTKASTLNISTSTKPHTTKLDTKIQKQHKKHKIEKLSKKTRKQERTLAKHILQHISPFSASSSSSSNDDDSSSLLFDMAPFDDGASSSSVSMFSTQQLMGAVKDDDINERTRRERERQQQHAPAPAAAAAKTSTSAAVVRVAAVEDTNSIPSIQYLKQLERDSLSSDPRTEVENAPGCFFHSKCTQHNNDNNNEKQQKQQKQLKKKNNKLLPLSAPSDSREGQVQLIDTARAYGWSNVWSNKRIACRCSACELSKIEPRLVQQDVHGPVRMVILMDLDNVGFEEFASSSSSSSAAASASSAAAAVSSSPFVFHQPAATAAATVAVVNNEDELWLKQVATKHAYLWGFYGGLFLDYVKTAHQQDLLAELERHDFVLPAETTTQNALQHCSVFEAFARTAHLRISNCGIKKQAADLAILSAVDHLTKHCPQLQVVIISGDRNLLTACHQFYAGSQQQHRPVIAAKPNFPREIPGIIRKIAMAM